MCRHRFHAIGCQGGARAHGLSGALAGTVALSLALLGFLGLAGCGRSGSSAKAATSTPAVVAPTVAPSATAAPTAVPGNGDPALQATEGLRALSTVVGWINGEPPLAEEFETRFSDQMLQDFPYDTFLVAHLQLSASAPWTVEEPVDNGLQTTAILRSEEHDDTLEVTITMLDGVIAGLFFAPHSSAELPTTLAEAIDALSGLGEFHYLIVEAPPSGFDDRCAGGTEAGADELIPIASIFKLYVLGAIVDAVGAGTTGWDADITISDALDSLPSGITQDDPAGTTLTVRELAERMITLSDNTATDHLIDHLGREAIEDALGDWGHSDPAATMPMLTTSELFKLKYAVGPSERSLYVDGSTDERRALLTDLIGLVALPSLDRFNPAPVDVTTLEWFATPRDLCRIIAKLRTDSEVARILALPSLTNSGSEDWAYEGSKGGSEPGVLAMIWAIERTDGESLVIVGSLVNEERDLSFDAFDLLDVFRDLAAAP